MEDDIDSDSSYEDVGSGSRRSTARSRYSSTYFDPIGPMYRSHSRNSSTYYEPYGRMHRHSSTFTEANPYGEAQNRNSSVYLLPPGPSGEMYSRRHRHSSTYLEPDPSGGRFADRSSGAYSRHGSTYHISEAAETSRAIKDTNGARGRFESVDASTSTEGTRRLSCDVSTSTEAFVDSRRVSHDVSTSTEKTYGNIRRISHASTSTKRRASLDSSTYTERTSRAQKGTGSEPVSPSASRKASRHQDNTELGKTSSKKKQTDAEKEEQPDSTTPPESAQPSCDQFWLSESGSSLGNLPARRT